MRLSAGVPCTGSVVRVFTPLAIRQLDSNSEGGGIRTHVLPPSWRLLSYELPPRLTLDYVVLAAPVSREFVGLDGLEPPTPDPRSGALPIELQSV